MLRSSQVLSFSKDNSIALLKAPPKYSNISNKHKEINQEAITYPL